MTDIPHLVDQEVVILKVWHGKALRDSLDRSRLEVDELRASRKRLVLAADADRRRIERELHDGPQQHLVALAANLQLARQLDGQSIRPRQRTLLDELRADVKEARRRRPGSSRNWIFPPLLEAGGLGVASALRGSERRRPYRRSRSPRTRPSRPRSPGQCTSAASRRSSALRPGRARRSPSATSTASVRVRDRRRRRQALLGRGSRRGAGPRRGARRPAGDRRRSRATAPASPDRSRRRDER